MMYNFDLNSIHGAKKLLIFKGFHEFLLKDVSFYSDEKMKEYLKQRKIDFDETGDFQVIENSIEPITKFIHILHVLNTSPNDLEGKISFIIRQV